MAKKGSVQLATKELPPVCAPRAVREARLERVKAHFPETFQLIVLTGHSAACTAAVMRRIEAYRQDVQKAFGALTDSPPSLGHEYPYEIPIVDSGEEVLVNLIRQSRLIEERARSLHSAVRTLLRIRPNDDTDPDVLRAWGRQMSSHLYFLAAIQAAGVSLSDAGPRLVADIAVCAGLDMNRIRSKDQLEETDEEVAERWRQRIREADIFPLRLVLAPRKRVLDERFWSDPNQPPDAQQAENPPDLFRTWRPPVLEVPAGDWTDPARPVHTHFQRPSSAFDAKALSKKSRGKPKT